MRSKVIIAFLLALICFKVNAQIQVGADGIIHSSISKGIVISNEAKGTLKSVLTIADRNGIADSLRTIGMLAFVKSDSSFYYLKNDITNASWTKWNSGLNAIKYYLPYNADQLYYLGGDSTLHPLSGVNVGLFNNNVNYFKGVPKYFLPYNGNGLYYLGGDSLLHQLPTDRVGISAVYPLDGLTKVNDSTFRIRKAYFDSLYYPLASNPANYLTNITSYVQQGTNVTITGNGTLANPYIISATASGGVADTSAYTKAQSDARFYPLTTNPANYFKGVPRYILPYNGQALYYLGGDSALHALNQVNVSTFPNDANYFKGTPIYRLPYNGNPNTYLGGDTILHLLPTVGGNYKLPYNANAQYYLGGDSVLHPGTSLNLSSGQIITGLGFTPYNSTNPAGYISDTSALHNQIAANIVAIGNRFDSLRLVGSVVQGRKNGVFIPQFTIPTGAGYTQSWGILINSNIIKADSSVLIPQPPTKIEDAVLVDHNGSYEDQLIDEQFVYNHGNVVNDNGFVRTDGTDGMSWYDSTGNGNGAYIGINGVMLNSKVSLREYNARWQYQDRDSAWKYFGSSSGGSGTIGNLQQVTDIGNLTTHNIAILQGGDVGGFVVKEYSSSGNDIIDATTKAALLKNDFRGELRLYNTESPSNLIMNEDKVQRVAKDGSIYNDSFPSKSGYFAITNNADGSITGVKSFNTRTGVVTPQSGDYTFAQIGSKPTTLSGYGITDAEPAIISGTTAQYWRGDKTWQTLNTSVVPESGNLYFTNARARTAISLTTTGTGAATYDNSTGILNIPTASAGTTYTETTENFTGGTSNVFTVSHTPATAKHIFADINGVLYKASNISQSGTSFTLSGVTVETSDVIRIKYSY